MNYSGLLKGSWTYTFTENKLYYIYANWTSTDLDYKFVLSWEYNGQTNTSIPSSNFFYPSYLSTRFITVKVIDYIWGNGIRNETEIWDDGNTKDGDGCSKDCKLEYEYTCNGGDYEHTDKWMEIWGDGIRLNKYAAYWDDKNTKNGDGWNNSCAIEKGWSWTGGTITSADSWTEIWGDGLRFNTNSTYCDDGNKYVGDGCDNKWAIEADWACKGGSNTSADKWTEICGDSKRYNTNSAYCDDGNKIVGDGCSDSWETEKGWSWTGGSKTSADSWTEIWGDGLRFNTNSTYCDDGNTKVGDGCDNNWAIETDWACKGGSNTSADKWTEIWGDSKRYNTNLAYCDDGNKIVGDGCSDSWETEKGWSWTGGSKTSADSWTEIWGDGLRFNTNSTYCDDGNTKVGDGCDNNWAIEADWACKGGSNTSADKWTEICGDSKRYNTNSAYCDDGNKIVGDGCSDSWETEKGWSWTGGSKTSADSWTEIWGDSMRFNTNSTYCDDGNTKVGDGCDNNWAIEADWACKGGSNTSADKWTEICGDSKRYNTNSAYCDDGNKIVGDGCSDSWVIETGWSWTGGSKTSADSWTEIWGDSMRYNTNSTYCDDGNTKVGDGCDNNWAIETGYSWTGGYKTSADKWTEICEDGIRFNTNSAYCDDGNKIVGDGCSDSWVIETGWSWTGGSKTSADSWNEIWGDSMRFNTNSTYCDDGNKNVGDGCDNNWAIETGYSWTGGSITSADKWTEICGDGIRFNTNSTYCDDGNKIVGDGCSDSWVIETGWSWTGGSKTSADSWNEICGDSMRFNTNLAYCDDGNTKVGDGCDNNWAIETGYSWTGGYKTSADKWTEICGDGIRFNTNLAYCDDGNNNEGDGCSDSWVIETGWSWTGGSKTSADSWNEICGDSMRFNTNSTYCDDGNKNVGDGCDNNWAIETGYSWTGGYKTSADKWTEICGDGIRFNTNLAYCDDGNNNDSDGCSYNCTKEKGWSWTGGSKTSADIWHEICGDGLRFNTNSTYWDDGNKIIGDGCNNIWVVESGWICTTSFTYSRDIWSLKSILSFQEKLASTLNQIIFGIGASFNIGYSLLSTSSPYGILSMMNHYQSLYIVIVSGSYVSEGVFNLITGVNIALFDFSFIKIENFNIFQRIYSYFAFNQTDSNLNKIGLIYGSSTLWLSKLILVILILVIFHLIFVPMHYAWKKLDQRNICARIGKRLYSILTFNIYARIAIQAYITILLSWFGEINELNIKTGIQLVSYWVNILICILIFTFYGLWILQIKKAHPQIKPKRQFYFIEFFSGLKNKTASRIYSAVFLSQRIISCLFVIMFARLDLTIKMVVLTPIQSACLLYLLFAKPFEEVKNLIIECLSQCILTFFCWILIFFNKKEQWSPTLSWILMGILMAFTTISTLIAISEFIILIVKKIKKSWCGETKVEHFRNNRPTVVSRVGPDFANAISREYEAQKS